MSFLLHCVMNFSLDLLLTFALKLAILSIRTVFWGGYELPVTGCGWCLCTGMANSQSCHTGRSKRKTEDMPPPVPSGKLALLTALLLNRKCHWPDRNLVQAFRTTARPQEHALATPAKTAHQGSVWTRHRTLPLGGNTWSATEAPAPFGQRLGTSRLSKTARAHCPPEQAS